MSRARVKGRVTFMSCFRWGLQRRARSCEDWDSPGSSRWATVPHMLLPGLGSDPPQRRLRCLQARREYMLRGVRECEDTEWELTASATGSIELGMRLRGSQLMGLDPVTRQRHCPPEPSFADWKRLSSAPTARGRHVLALPRTNASHH